VCARAIEYAGVLGCAAPQLHRRKGRAGEDRARLRAILSSNLEFAAREIRKAGLDFVVEPINDRDIPGFFLTRQHEAAELIAEIGSGNLGLQCDLYHTVMMGDDPAATLQTLMPVIRHVQFADRAGSRRARHRRIDFEPLFALLDRLGYGGWISAEYRPSRVTEATLDWLPR
jgi:hydroxypyruvate isomerase